PTSWSPAPRRSCTYTFTTRRLRQHRTNLQAPRGYNDIITKKSLEQNTDLARRSEIDCDNPWLGVDWT
ncbi:MAG: hypothetical protein ACKPKO_29990, partial [Candidatus Fonsibacter sp.]